MYLLTPSKLLVHEPFQFTWELMQAPHIPSVTWQVLQLCCSLWAAWLTRTEKQLRRNGSAKGRMAGFLFGVCVPGFKETSF